VVLHAGEEDAGELEALEAVEGRDAHALAGGGGLALDEADREVVRFEEGEEVVAELAGGGGDADGLGLSGL